MVTLILFIAILGAMLIFSYEDIIPDPVYVIGEIILPIIALICIVWSIWNVITVASGAGLNEKIVIYEEENAQIEESIDAAVEAYCEHEQITYVRMADKAVALVAAAYPELASCELVSTQISIWTENCAELKKLKSDYVDYKKACWFLYFGGRV